MEKTTQKRKKSKRARRRIGLIAVGGLSFVLTICLSVGATLAWFAGSTWASNDLYMGGPVYVEMAGRGENGYIKDGDTDANDNDALDNAVWQGGSGTLDIKASSRSTGTARTGELGAEGDQNKDNNILLPGQKLLVYSQARVYSTLKESTLTDGATPNQSSGADNSNTIKNGTMTYYSGAGRVQTTTTSVLRAKFSINIEFDPSVGFNNFTDKVYAEGYPVQSSKYLGEYGAQATGTSEIGTVNTGDAASKQEASRAAGSDGKLNTDDDVVVMKDSLTWDSSLGKTPYKITRKTTTTGNAGEQESTTEVLSEVGRRDAVAKTALDTAKYDTTLTGISTGDVFNWVDGSTSTDLWQMKWGLSKSIYKWKYVSESVWKSCGGNIETGEGSGTATANGIAIGAPFNGRYNTAGGPSAKVTSGTGNGYYAVWEVVNTAAEGDPAVYAKAESDAYYNARTSAYLKSYVENYTDEYDRKLTMEIGTSLETLETALNNSFINLVNQSSDNIWAGNVMGFDAESDGRISYDTDEQVTAGIKASWLYVDPTIGNDTNASDSASSVGGWWYLVASDGGNRSSGDQLITTEIDNVIADSKSGATGATTYNDNGTVKYTYTTGTDGTLPADAVNDPITPTGSETGNEKYAAPFKRHEDDGKDGVKNTDKRILNAKLYEITPKLTDKLIATAADGTTTTKVVSYAFPFVNGNFELPGQAMTNIFANAKISFQITFQALQAFFPFSNSIDSIPSGTAITGTGKALNIGNAIPIYNEAFDYLSWL